MRRNTVITEVNGHAVKNAEQFEKKVKGAKAKSCSRQLAGVGQISPPFFALAQVP